MLAAALLALVSPAPGALAQGADAEQAANARRIAQIDQEAGPLAAQLRQASAAIDQHNQSPVDRRDAAAVAAYNARADQLNAAKNALVAKLSALVKEQDQLKARNAALESAARQAVAREQDEFERMNAAWLRNQERLIRASVAADAARRRAVLESIRRIEVPPPQIQPRTLDDLLPGDILLFEPESGWNQVIPPADYFYRVASDFARGDVHAAIGRRPAPVSHALTFIRQVNGVQLFLDHTHEGSRVLDRRELARKYHTRKTYVARPETAPDGRRLWAAAHDAALKKGAYFGVLPGQQVCSERACAVLAKGSSSMPSGTRLGIVDVTPGDFFDGQAMGKYFVVSPIER